MSNHETVNEILVRLFANILDIEEKCLKIGEFSDLSITEMHVIDNIGLTSERTMSDTAKAVKVTDVYKRQYFERHKGQYRPVLDRGYRRRILGFKSRNRVFDFVREPDL